MLKRLDSVADSKKPFVVVIDSVEAGLLANRACQSMCHCPSAFASKPVPTVRVNLGSAHLQLIQRLVDYGFGYVDQVYDGERQVAFDAAEVLCAFTGCGHGASQQARGVGQGFFERFVGWVGG